MKRLIVLLVLFALPLSLFAQLHIGVTALYLSDPETVADLKAEENVIDQFGFGVDARLQISIFEVSALALYQVGGSFNTYLDGGVALDFAIVTIGAGVGINTIVSFNDETYPDTMALGYNAKIHGDLNLGNIKVSAYYMFVVDTFDLEAFQDNMRMGNIGVSVLFKLF
ncbi:MAG: hypothetical protein EHM28_07585 [Spirochaetaceae bacterium]|nr:MAG: hypothetical protein EHM28_07585 [Spirochaetaceae bacterium]